jgi:membrane glycosyltransferase
MPAGKEAIPVGSKAIPAGIAHSCRKRHDSGWKHDDSCRHRVASGWKRGNSCRKNGGFHGRARPPGTRCHFWIHWQAVSPYYYVMPESKMAETPLLADVPVPRLRRGWRLFLFYSSAVLLTGFVAMLFADLLWRTGWSASRTVLLVLFIILFLLTAVGCMHGVYGFFIRIFGTSRRITALKNFQEQAIDGVSTAIIFPIYNEDSVRVLEGLRATYESLQRTGQLERFDFFILSDSTNPDCWVEEERRWSELVCDLDALGKIYYRRRLFNEERKSGNVRDFSTPGASATVISSAATPTA